MTAVNLTCILMADEGFRLDQTASYIIGATAATVLFGIYLFTLARQKERMTQSLFYDGADKFET